MTSPKEEEERKLVRSLEDEDEMTEEDIESQEANERRKKMSKSSSVFKEHSSMCTLELSRGQIH